MRRKILKSFLVLVLILTSLLIPANIVYADDEDLTTYTEYDTGADATVTANKIEVRNAPDTTGLAVYKDFGSSYFDEDWYVDFTWTDVDGGYIGANHAHMCFSNYAPNNLNVGWFDIKTNTAVADTIGIFSTWTNPNFEWTIFEKKQGSSYTQSGSVTYNRLAYIGVPVYISVWFDDDTGTYGTIYLEVFSDSDRTASLGSTSKALTEENSWQYFNCTLGDAWSSSAGTKDWDIEDVELTEGNPPEIVNDTAVYDSYNPYQEEHYYQISGNITEDGGSDQYVTFYWKEDGESTYDSWTRPETYNTGERATYIIVVEDGKTYWWYTEIWSGLGTFSDDPESFVASVEEGIPIMSTNFFYTTYANGDNSTVTLTGGVAYDGGANVTGYMQYSENITDWTDSSAYGTPLQTDDSFSINVTGLSENTRYYYRSKGTNANGTNYGGIFTFEIIDWAYPDLEVVASNVTSNSAVFEITLTDDGNETEIWTYYEIREQGTEDWTTPNVILGNPNATYMSENETRYVTNYGLTASTTYEYRGSAFGQCYMQGFCENITHTEILSFTTSAVNQIPTVELDEVGYTDDFTMYGTATVTNDANWDCTVSLEFKLATADNSAWGRNILLNPTQFCSGLDTDDSCTTFIYPVTLEKMYAVRARVENTLGYFSYSNVITYFHESGSTSSNASISTGYIWLEPVEDFLANYGLNNSGGRLLVVIIVMIIAFLLIVLLPGRKFQDYVRFTVPIAGAVVSVILVLGMVIGYVPPVITATILIVFGGVLAVFVIRIFKSSGNEVE